MRKVNKYERGQLIMGFIDVIKEKARADKKTIVLPESEDRRVLEATATILKEGLANVVLIGNEEQIKKDAADLDIAGAIIVDPATSDKTQAYIDKLVELRQKKGMTQEQAREIMLNQRTYYGVMMVKMGDADGMVSGACHSAESFKMLVGKEPKVAMLSHSSMGSAKHADVDKVVEAVKIAKETAPELMLDGELQLDAAIVPSVGASKAPNSQVAGQANVLIFPDLDAGNIGYKLVQRLAKAEAYGPMTQGIAAPVNDLSRGCSASDIVGVTAITAVQCQNQ